MAWTMITTTSYGTWLPGDGRGYVQHGEILPPEPRLERHAAELLKSPPVILSQPEQNRITIALVEAAKEFGYDLTDLSVESWHVHWILKHDDKVAAMVGRLKNRSRQAVGRGQIWTKGYHYNPLHTEAAILAASDYIARHAGVRLVNRLAVGE
jgi:REP element-mobilizing transposase RayT